MVRMLAHASCRQVHSVTWLAWPRSLNLYRAGRRHDGPECYTKSGAVMAIQNGSTLDRPPVEQAWGEGLAYPEWIRRAPPAVHDAFNGANRYVGVPALKMGLGRCISNPLTGYLMILRT